jgi:hypothetical protein
VPWAALLELPDLGFLGEDGVSVLELSLVPDAAT